MSIRDLNSNIKASYSLVPAAQTASTTGTGVDLQGFDSAAIILLAGARTDGSFTPSIEHSMDGASYSPVGEADLDGVFTAIDGTGGQNAMQRVGYLGTRRYVRVKLAASGATGGAVIGALVLGGHPRQAPVV